MEVLLPRSRDGIIEVLRRNRLEELDALHRAYPHDRYFSLLLTWAFGWLRRARRAAVEDLPEVAAGELAISFGGHASALLRYQGHAIACDPMLGGRLGLIKRAARPGLHAEQLATCDLILITQSGPAHLHVPTLRHLDPQATIVVPPRGGALVSGLGFARIIELGIGQSVRHRDVDVVSTPVRRAGRAPSCAYVIRGPGPSIYYCAGSGYFSGFAEVGTRFRPDVALLPIGGYLPRSFRDAHLSPLDALYAFEDLNARLLIPIRHSAFILSYEKLDEPVAWLRRLVQERELEPFVSMMAPGESRKFVLPLASPP